MAKVDLSIISDEDLKIGMNKSLSNASSLLDESKILFQANKIARAFTLAQLSAEEVGKARLLLVLLLNRGSGDPIDYKEVNRSYVSHQSKSGSSLFFELFGLQMFNKKSNSGDAEARYNKLKDEILYIEAHPQEQDDKKNASLYVGIDANKFIEPEQVFDKQEVNDFISIVGIRLEVAKVVLQEMAKDVGALVKLIKEAEKTGIDSSGYGLENLHFDSF